MRKTLRTKAVRWRPAASTEPMKELAGFESGRIDLVPSIVVLSNGQNLVDIHARFRDPTEARWLFEIYMAGGAIDGEVDYKEGGRIETLPIKNRKVLRGDLMGFRGSFDLHVTASLVAPFGRHLKKE